MPAKHPTPAKKVVKSTAKRRKLVTLPFWHRTRVLTGVFILAILSMSTFGLGFLVNDSQMVNAAPCRQADTKVNVRYPVSGYFTFTSADQCATRSILQSMHKIGADTAITFGSSLKPSSAATLRSDSTYKNFRQDGKNGYDIAKAATSGGKIAKVYTYSDKITFASSAHQCGGRDGVIKNSAGVFNWFLLPVDAGYSDCKSPSKTYDLVVTHSKSATDANTLMVNEAANYGMQVYLGLPKVHNHDNSFSHTFGSFTTRVVKSWSQLYGGKSSFAGVYQTDEVYLGHKLSKNTLKLYNIQHQIVGWHMKSSKQVVLVSPYTSLLKSGGNSLAAVTSAAKQVAATKHKVKMIMLPQDGAGTGRVGLYDPFQANSQVRSVEKSALGLRGTNAQNYVADTQGFMRAVKSGIGSMELWGNVEAFTPGGVVGKRPLSNRTTLDKQVRRVAPVVSKVVAYRWDYMTSAPRASATSLYKSIYINGSKPTLATVTRISGGIQLVGYQLERGGKSTITVTSNGKSRKYTVSANKFTTYLKGRMDVLRLPVSGLVKGKAVYVQVYNGTQLTNTLGAFY